MIEVAEFELPAGRRPRPRWGYSNDKGRSLKSMRVEGTTKGPRLPTYLPTYPVRTYVPTTISFLGWRNSQRWLLLAAAAPVVGRQAAASNTSYLLHLLHLLLLVLSICLLSRATRRDLCVPLPPSPFISSLVPSARARARVNLLYIIVVEITTTIQDYLPYRYHHGTVHTVLLRNRIAATPVALRATPIRARSHTYMHTWACT